MLNKFRKRINELDLCQMRNLIVLIFISNVILRGIFVFLVRTLYIVPDEVIYLNIAKSFANDFSVLVHGTTLDIESVLYALIIAPVMLISNPIVRIISVGIVNVIIMTSTIIPVYLLTKKIFCSNDLSLVCVISILLLPDMAMSRTFMSEVLFFPLCAWLFLYVYYFITADNYRKRNVYCIIIAFICTCIYATKAVGLYFVISFVVTLLVDCIFINKDARKRNFINLCYFLIFFALFYYIFHILICKNIWGISSAYYNISKYEMFNIKNFIFYLYGVLFNLISVVLAFMYFPVIITLYEFKDLSNDKKNLLVFATSSLMVAIAVVTYKVTVVEQYGMRAFRQHLRYYSPLFILFIILFVYIILNNKRECKKRNKTLLVAITSIGLFLFLIIFKTFYGVSVDGVLLQYIYAIHRILISGQTVWGISSVEVIEFILKVAVTILVILGTLFLYTKKQYFIRSFLIGFLAICLMNNYFAYYLFAGEEPIGYSTLKNDIKDIDYIDKYLEGKSGNVLIVTDGLFNKVIDTYFLKRSYYTSKELIISTAGNKGYIDLMQDKLVSCYPGNEYKGLNKIDYILTDNSTEFYGEDIEKIELPIGKDFSLYKNSSTKLNVSMKSVFPQYVGETKYLYPQESKLYTNFKVNGEKSFVSTGNNAGSVLVYGPYEPIMKGEYIFEFYYDYLSKSEIKMELGFADIYISDIDKVLNSSTIYSDENMVSIGPISINENYFKMETRMFTNVKDVEFKKIIVKKIQ